MHCRLGSAYVTSLPPVLEIRQQYLLKHFVSQSLFFCDHCENRNSVFSLIVSHNSLEVVLVHGRAELGVAAWLPLSLCYLPAVYTEAAQRELHLFELECDCSYTGAAGEGMMLFHHCPPLPQTLTACTHTHTLLWTPVSATQPVNLRERETGRGGGCWSEV